MMTHYRVREALSGPDACHRETEVTELIGDIRRDLVEICDGDQRWHSAVLITGSGTAAVEATLISAVQRDRVLVIVNGHYGERLLDIARSHGLDVEPFKLAWQQEIDLEVLDSKLRADPLIKYIALVHHETSTGMLNDAAAVSRSARAHGVEVILDAVSSLGCEPLSISTGGADWIVSSANKCIEGAPGLSFVVAKRRLMEALPTQARGYYLDIGRYFRSQESKSVPFTPAVPILRALSVACGLLKEETVAGRALRYSFLTEKVRDGLSRLGIRSDLSPEHRSSSLTAFEIPTGWTYAELHDQLREHGFVIYASQGERAGKQFRIATMGQIPSGEIDRLLLVLEEMLSSQGGPL
ncbi:aminotransferase class V-fold PLP-dependent enzyme [Rathayibacter toxicus]|nr:aminotransferase class V-fold PLP-dependent enzyme [Rathayibacter toxicus]